MVAGIFARTARRTAVALSDIDRDLLQRCLGRGPRAWEDFVDRFLGLVLHVITHTAQTRSIRLTTQDREDLSAEVFLALVQDDFAILRRFRGESSLATYLTIISRRIIVHHLQKRRSTSSLSDSQERSDPRATNSPRPEERISNRDEVERMLRALHGPEAEIIRMYHLEGKSYQEISSSVGMPENSIGPTLSRARAKMRSAGLDPAT